MSIAPSLHTLGTSIVMLDTQNQVVYLNQSAEQLLGFSGRQAMSENFFDLIRGDLDAKLISQFSHQQQTAFLEEMELKTATGIVTANVMLSNYEEDGIEYLVMELQTSEHHAHIRKDMELQQQSRVSNHLIRNLAHEIKNPLGGIKGAAQLMERKLPSEYSNKYTQIIIQEADRLSSLVGRLLLPAEPEAQSQINPHQIIDKAVDVLMLQQSHKIQIVKDYDPSLPEINVSAGQIQQALMNLIKNAMEATDEHGEVRLRTRILHQQTIGKLQHRQVIRIDVIDDGDGIPDNIKRDIFFPTISGKNSSGLGLSIAQSLAQRHGGIIEVENLPGHTCFSLYLPVVNEND
ncbi:PAS domain-containing protein [Aliikangiella marina]|uniref:Sensory histidine kinase/phosphatase NtrB n=1 Tax=Aliikangiella marina TaxID=1712262 RepID=A0A545TBH2_9GAMM|nr:nitrogen regulation protein NR(II) [Aliikangiella marina]TQV74573.1 PAS domain-containing protein [Aliikangiella marina]